MDRFRLAARRTEPVTVNEVCTSVLSPIVIGAVLLGILLGTSGNCEYDIRLWLWVVFGVNLVYVVLIILVIGVSLMAKQDQDGLQCAGLTAVLCRSLLSLFMLVWLIVGNVWLFSSDSCSSDWLSGYVATLIFLIFGYIAFAMILCCLCCQVGPLNVMLTKDRQSLDHENHQPLQG
jgi:bacteriorhodopsin